MDRFLSEYKMIHRASRLDSAADMAHMNDMMLRTSRNMARAFDADPDFAAVKDCHMIPQRLYVWDAAGACTCGHVLRFSSVQDDFDALMAAYDLPYRLESTKPTTHHEPTPVTVANISRDVTRLLRHAYADDYRLLFDAPCALDSTRCRPLGAACQPSPKKPPAPASEPPCVAFACEDQTQSMPKCKRRVKVPCTNETRQ